MATTGYISVSYFRENNPTLDLSLYTDTTISGMILSASRQVDAFLNYSPAVETITDEKMLGYVDNDRNLVVFPRKRPLLTISSISLVKGTDVIDLDLTDGNEAKYDIPSSQDRVVYPDNELAFNSVSIIQSFWSLRATKFFTKITYTAGYYTIPSDIQDATALLVRDRVARSLNAAGARSISQGGISITYGGTNKGKSDNVEDAETLLMPYKRITPF